MTRISCCRRWRQIASWKKPCRWRNCGIVELKNSAIKSEEMCNRVRMFEQRHVLAEVVSKWGNFLKNFVSNFSLFGGVEIQILKISWLPLGEPPTGSWPYRSTTVAWHNGKAKQVELSQGKNFKRQASWNYHELPINCLFWGDAVLETCMVT